MSIKHGSMAGSHHIEPDRSLGGPLAKFEVGGRQAAEPCCIDAMSCIMAGYVRVYLVLLHSSWKTLKIRLTRGVYILTHQRAITEGAKQAFCCSSFLVSFSTDCALPPLLCG